MVAAATARNAKAVEPQRADGKKAKSRAANIASSASLKDKQPSAKKRQERYGTFYSVVCCADRPELLIGSALQSVLPCVVALRRKYSAVSGTVPQYSAVSGTDSEQRRLARARPLACCTCSDCWTVSGSAQSAGTAHSTQHNTTPAAAVASAAAAASAAVALATTVSEWHTLQSGLASTHCKP